MAAVVFEIGLIYFVGHLFAFTFAKYKIPDVLLFMIFGIIIGPILAITSPEDFGAAGRVLSTMALLVILFQSGVTLNLKSFAEVLGQGTLITFATALFTAGLVCLLSYPFLKSWELSVLTGIILCGTSSAVAIPMSQALRMSERAQNIVLLESSLTDVLCIVLTLALARAFAVGGGLEMSGVVGQIFLSFTVAMLIGLAAGAAWSHFKQKMRSLATIAFAMALYGLVELLDFSGPIAVMSMGFAITNTSKFTNKFSSVGLTEAETEFYTELSFALKTFFFIFLGISMKFNSPLMLGAGAILTVLILIARKFLVNFTLKNGFSPSDMTFTTLLIPKGLAAAVLAEVPVQMRIPGAEMVPQFVYATVLVSIVIVSLLIPWFGLKLSRGSQPAPLTTSGGQSTKLG